MKEREASSKPNSLSTGELSSVVAQLMKRQEVMEKGNIAAMASVTSTMQQMQQSMRSYAPVISNANKRKRHDQVFFVLAS